MTMTKFKKTMVASITAIALSLNICSALSVSAATYDSRDVDRNGTMNIYDWFLLDRCLSGNSYISNNAILDADKNLIVSDVDKTCISAGVVGSSFTNRVKGASNAFGAYDTSVAPSTGHELSCTYMTRNYKEGYFSGYTLNMSEYNFSTAAYNDDDTPGIIGPDSREADALESIVYLSTGGTGFIVGDHVIATAAHCVYERKPSSSFIDDLHVYLPDENGKATTTPLTTVEAHVPFEYLRDTSKYDYALISVEEDLSDYYHFKLGMPYNVYTDSLFEKYTIYTTGYSQFIPETGKENSYPTPQMYTGNGKIINTSESNKNVLCYDADMTYGNSGGPVYVKETYTKGSNAPVEQMTVIGINTYTCGVYNGGPMINAMMLNFYKNNSNIKIG